jgi:Bacterial Ig domain
MRSNIVKSILIKSGLAASVLLLATAASFAQSVNLTAGPVTATLPDGSAVPMWGYTCGAVVAPATCAATNAKVTAATPLAWSPVVISAPTGSSLTINLTNSLAFGTGGANKIPTSMVIVGLIGGGLGTTATAAPSPAHAGLGVSWPVAGGPDSGVSGNANAGNPTFTPPPQGNRVQSFSTEVAAGTTTGLTWSNLKAGTYLIESGTHPSIQGPMGLYGILVVTTAPVAGTSAGIAYPAVGTQAAVSYNSEIPLLLSEIDPVQNNAVNTAVNNAAFSETMVWSGQPGGCGNPASTNFGACYPPAVNYTPLYYLFNGVAFDKTNAANSLFPASLGSATAPVTGNLLVRLVNAGVHMHVPSIVGAVTGTPAVSGFGLIAEDGNRLPGVTRVQSEVFLAPGKTYDVMINAPTAVAPATTPPALAIYDRELSLSGNAIGRDAGMLAYIGANGATLPLAAAFGAATANPDTYNSVINCTATPCAAVTVTDASKGLIANDVNVYGVKVLTGSGPTKGTVTLNANGTFTYVPNVGATLFGTTASPTPDSFTYCGNGATSGAACAVVTLGPAPIEGSNGISLANNSFTSNIATFMTITPPGILAGAVDAAGYPLTVGTVSTLTGGPGTGTLTMDPNGNGGFNATVSAPGTYTFTYTAQNSQGTKSTASGTVTLNFLPGSKLTVAVVDGKSRLTLPLQGPNNVADYRWIIEEDTTFFVDPNCAQNPSPLGCPGSSKPPAGGSVVVNGAPVAVLPTFGTNFHTSHMNFVAQGCTGPLSCEGGQTVLNQPVVCDLGNGACRPDPTGNGRTPVLPSSVNLDPSKRYYISVLPGDAATPFINGYGGTPCATSGPSADCAIGHGMGGSPIAALCNLPSPTGATPCGTGLTYPTVTILSQASPYQPGKLSLIVFEDDFPLNGEQDAGGGIDVLAPNEPGLGGFNVQLWDPMGGNGDFTGQMTYDMFNQPLTNSLDGTIDPLTQMNACPITQQAAGITGMIVTCPKYESDGKTLSPLAGQVVVNNLMQGRFEVIATPGADRIARGEEWLQTNTLDGQKAHDTFIRIGEPTYFQEFGPSGYHAVIGFANPKIINGRKAGVCAGTDPNLPSPTAIDCSNTITGSVTTERMSRTPDERLYGSGNHNSFFWTNCYVSFGDPDGEDFAFTKCDDKGNFTLTGLPAGTWRVTVFDQWNDMLVDGLSTPVAIAGGGSTTNMGEIATNQWQVNLYTRTFIDDNKDGISQSTEAGIPLINTAVRYRDGSLANNLVTDFTGTADFNETFPLFNWYVVETDTTRYKNTGTHVVYDAGGPADGTSACGKPGYPVCGSSVIGANMANTAETVSLPSDLRVPGAVYCTNADCTGFSINPAVSGGTNVSPTCTYKAGNPSANPPVQPAVTCSTPLSTGRIDPPWAGGTEGWQSFSGQNNWLEFGKEPYVPGENGGIKGHVVYASTRPFDDPQMLVQTQWEPLVPNVTINLYQETTAADGSTALKLVDTTVTSSWDSWAQGFYQAPVGTTGTTTPKLSTAAGGNGGIPYMSCPGQSTADLFYFTLLNQPNYLNLYSAEHGGPAVTPLAYGSQFKCYDSMHNWNQLQPAPYDGMYKFPSVTVTGTDANGKPTLTGTNCTICKANTLVPSTDMYYNTPMLPVGKYVVEVVVPPGYELVKEEDKNILIGDNYIAPAVQEFGGLGDIFIMPDQAQVGSAYNANNAQNSTQSLGAVPNNGIVPGFTPEPTWPCVGEKRIVPDYISLFPQSSQVSPFAGATRNLCDRKEVTLADQTGAIAKFYVFTSTHIASKFTGVITDDFTSEFDPFSPQFGEKFSPPNMPIAFKDWTGAETSRVYSDQWGAFNGLTYSTWEVNPPNPTGYSPTMMVTCMNDPGSSATPDPLFNPAYSQFCYELPFMPGWTTYMDTPVVPTSAFAGAGYNNPDCDYPAATPAVSEVDGDGKGPWVSAAGKTLTITALGDHTVFNYGYSGPAANTAPFNQKTVTRHYGFGTQCTSPTSTSTTCNTASSVTIGGVKATVTNWSDLTLTVTVPATGGPKGIPACSIQQQAQYGGSTAYCGELVITAGNGKQSIDAVTVTVGGKTPTHVPATGTIQAAIDAALPGDMLMVDPGMHNEMLLMWKPLRLQGVGAASSVINAITQFGELDPWRAQVNCLFGLALNGQPVNDTGADITFPDGSPTIKVNPYDATGARVCGKTSAGVAWGGFSGAANAPQVDRIPLEGIVGWDTTLNGNLAQLLQEPTLMGAYEGAAITVLGRGVRYPEPPLINEATGKAFSPTNIFGNGADTAAGSLIAHEGQMPVPTVLLTNTTLDCGGTTIIRGKSVFTPNPFPSSFQCNPSRIDGLAVTDSSQGGGGIFVHGWAHNLEISNNRVYNNTGTLTGGIVIGQGESPDALLSGNSGDPIGYNGGTPGGFDQQPWTCLPGASGPGNTENVSPDGTAINEQLPFCYNVNVNVHHNAITRNSSIGDELFSGTPAGAGGATFCTGADYYKFNYNWVCGNLSTGDGGGVSHLGYSWYGDIEHNQILFNQSTNPTIATNGGGIIVMGAAPDGTPPGAAAGTECGSVTDVDCPPGLPDGTGPGMVVNANLLMGNAADSGSGGGLRLQSVNGTEVSFFPRNPTPQRTTSGTFAGWTGDFPGLLSGRNANPGWNMVTVTNNIIANNVAGWDGAGVSLQDALYVNLINNTIMANDTTASSGVLFNTIGAPDASAPGVGLSGQQTSSTTSAPQPAGLVSMQNSSNLTATFSGLTLTCPPNHYAGTAANNGSCRGFSFPYMTNDVFWQNRAFYIGVGALSATYQQNIVALYNAISGTPAANQPSGDLISKVGNGSVITGGTGACTPGATYWDIGVRGDTAPGNHGSGLTLAPIYSVLTNPAEIGGGSNVLTANPTAVSQYCNGSRTPPEALQVLGAAGAGWQVPPGISDAQVPNPIFSLTPNATVDEGNNWINLSWGPLAQANPAATTTTSTSSVPLGNYALASGSPAINYIPPGNASYTAAPSLDFFGNTRPSGSGVDVGAVEFQGASTTLAYVSPTALNFGNVLVTTPATTSAPQSLTVNRGGQALTITSLVFSSPAYTQATAAQGGAGTCVVGTPVPAAGCTINVVFTPTTAGTVTATLTINGGAIDGSPVALTGTGVVPTRTATVSPSPLAFGTWATGTTSSAQTLTVTNTGNTALATGTFTFGTPGVFTRATAAQGGAGTCAATLAIGASCTFNVVFAPTAATAYSRTLTVAYAGATVTPATVTLTGTGVATRATATIAPNPLTITLPTGAANFTGTGPVTLTNTAPSGGAQFTVGTVTVSGGNIFSFFFNKVAGGDACTGATLAPGASCTVQVRFTNVLSARGTTRVGAITFTDNAGASPQAGVLHGFATP